MPLPTLAYAHPHRVGRWAIAALYACAVVNALVALAHGVHVLLLRRHRVANVPESLFAAYDDAMRWVAPVSIVLFLVMAPLFLVWFRRVHVNVRSFGATGLSFSPGWAVGSFFVPGLNLLAPYLAASQAWRASDPERLDPDGWKDTPGSRLVMAWWGTYVGAVAFNYVTGRNQPWGDDRVHAWLVFMTFAIVTRVMGVAAALLAAAMIRDLDRRQEAKRLRLEAVSFA